MRDVLLSVQSVSKSFGSYRALQDVNLDVKHGEFIAMLGPSGCGKTTLLRLIAGFMHPDQGRILISGDDMTRRPPNTRPLNTVFQNYALFPHMRVFHNVAYGPRRHRVSRQMVRDRVQEALELVSLGHLADRYPRELSGGQQQRVALARALVNRPKLLLLDEPLSALDAKLRKHMQIELKRLQQKLGISFVFVTHDQEEAMTMADRIVAMNVGRIEQIGQGEEIYNRPSTRFVADFVGEANFIPCTIGPNGTLQPAVGTRAFRAEDGHGGKACFAMLRPEHLKLLRERDGNMSLAEGIVDEVLNVGPYSTVIVEAGGQQINIRCDNNDPLPARGQAVLFGYRPDHARIIAE